MYRPTGTKHCHKTQFRKNTVDSHFKLKYFLAVEFNLIYFMMNFFEVVER